MMEDGKWKGEKGVLELWNRDKLNDLKIRDYRENYKGFTIKFFLIILSHRSIAALS